LLITISLIVILVSILTLALGAARTAAQVAETQSRLTALKQATVRFKSDVGYYPAVLDDQRNLAAFPIYPSPTSGSPQQMYRYQVQEWNSITSPAEFLVGYGNQAHDGYGRLPGAGSGDASWEEIPRFGIRHPNVDGVWRASEGGTALSDGSIGTGDGLLTERLPSPRGKLFGPYLEIENEQMYGRLVFETDGETPKTDPVTGQIKVFYPGDPDYLIDNPMIIVDTWGTPIRYYRTLYPNPEPIFNQDLPPRSGIARVFPPSNNYNRPLLSDFIALRPFKFDPNKVIDTTLPDYMGGFDDAVGDTSTTM
jgi:type II secretory pathway pseudopilin PulG